MKTLIDATNISNKITGAGVCTYKVLAEIARRGETGKYDVLVKEDLNKKNRIFDLPFNFVCLDIPTIGPKRDIKLSLFLFLKRKKYETLLSFMPYLPFFFSLKDSVVVVHDLGYLNYPQFFERNNFFWYYCLIVKRSLLKSRRVLTVSESTKKDAVEKFGLSADKIVVIGLGPNIDFDGKERVNRGKDPYFLFVGEFRPHKNLKNLIKAFGLFKEQDSVGFKLLLVGSDYHGHKSELIEEIAKLGLEKEVIIQTGVSDSDLKEIYRDSYAFILPSFYEGFGIPVLEAMNTGVPVLVSDVYSLPEVAKDAGLYFDPNNPSQMKDQMLLVGDENLREKMITKGKEVASSFSWSETTRKVLDTL